MSGVEDVRPMRLVSYAQNREDILLYRALSHIERGRYVDVGAAWPKQDSVTLLFYERGWSGVNVEPNPQFLAALRNERTRDVNLGQAVGTPRGIASFALIPDTGLSTLDTGLAAQHRATGREVVWIDVTVETLESILDEHVPDGPIHFLKIDVEGAEADVIASNDWSRFRPWVVVAEVGNPSNPTDDDPAWESELLGRDYLKVFDDGVNRFYLAAEHNDLAHAFSVPPNALDDFVSSSVVDLEQALIALHSAEAQARDSNWRLEKERERAQWLEHEAQTTRAELEWRLELQTAAAREEARKLRIANAEARAEATADRFALDANIRRVNDLTKQNEALHGQIASMLASRSWQVTRPLRIGYSLREAPGPGLRYIVYRLAGGRFGTMRLIRPRDAAEAQIGLMRRLRARLARSVAVIGVPAPTPSGGEAPQPIDVSAASIAEADCFAALHSIGHATAHRHA